jgi:hypothetical protein
MRNIAKFSARFTAAILAVASLTPFAQAQSEPHAVQLNVPFAFETQLGQHFQPGVYIFSIVNSQSLLIRNANSNGMAMFQRQDNERVSAPQSKAVFTHYGNKYYLYSVSLPGSSTRLQFGRSKAERQSQVASRKPFAATELAFLLPGR